ncbi:MAG: hydantoinase/oxoprolinase [Rhodospirillales bacterium]|nr:hydantoinase/oxoprolinase [Rhodospirillales bacterium]
MGSDGHLLGARRVPCPLWQGMEALDQALATAMSEFHGDAHALTMTGELADIFPDRREGVRCLLERSTAILGNGHLSIYAGRSGFVAPAACERYSYDIASANWHASAELAAKHLEYGILMDIGSTTTDIVEFGQGRVGFRGYTDGERLASDELVYTGVLRTPVFGVVSRAPFRGEWQSLAAERFATMADVYTLTEDLEEPARWVPPETADGRGIDAADCARRLARMLGRDADALDEWRSVARYIAGIHQHGIGQALRRMLSRRPALRTYPLVGAGIGRFIVRDLARGLGHPYLDFSSLLPGAAGALETEAAICAPAVAVAYLLKDPCCIRR